MNLRSPQLERRLRREVRKRRRANGDPFRKIYDHPIQTLGRWGGLALVMAFFGVVASFFAYGFFRDEERAATATVGILGLALACIAASFTHLGAPVNWRIYFLTNLPIPRDRLERALITRPRWLHLLVFGYTAAIGAFAMLSTQNVDLPISSILIAVLICAVICTATVDLLTMNFHTAVWPWHAIGMGGVALAVVIGNGDNWPGVPQAAQLCGWLPPVWGLHLLDVPALAPRLPVWLVAAAAVGLPAAAAMQRRRLRQTFHLPELSEIDLQQLRADDEDETDDDTAFDFERPCDTPPATRDGVAAALAKCLRETSSRPPVAALIPATERPRYWRGALICAISIPLAAAGFIWAAVFLWCACYTLAAHLMETDLRGLHKVQIGNAHTRFCLLMPCSFRQLATALTRHLYRRALPATIIHGTIGISAAFLTEKPTYFAYWLAYVAGLHLATIPAQAALRIASESRSVRPWLPRNLLPQLVAVPVVISFGLCIVLTLAIGNPVTRLICLPLAAAIAWLVVWIGIRLVDHGDQSRLLPADQ